MNENDVLPGLRLVCKKSRELHHFISEYLKLEKEIFYDFESELITNTNRNEKKYINELSKIEEAQIDDEKLSEMLSNMEISDPKEKKRENNKVLNFKKKYLNLYEG